MSNPFGRSWIGLRLCPLMPDDLWIAIALGVLGLLVGSFLNVVIARVPDGRSIITPASACPKCGAQLRWRDNIPLLSWCMLRGRCRTCAQPISVRYPMVEGLNALLWLSLYWWAQAVPDRFSLLPVLLLLASAGLALAAIDIEHHRLPDVIVLPLYPIAAIGLLLNQTISGQGHWLDALTGAAIWGLTIGGLWLITSGRGMGLGDAKLAPVLGGVIGWLGIAQASIGLLSAFLMGAILGAAFLASGRHARRARMAFGPFLLSGALLAVLFGQPLWHEYSRLTGL